MTSDDDDVQVIAPGPKIGDLIAERYRLLSLIAEGGMGRVYRAEHVALREPVVVKFLHPMLASQSLIRQRFRLEAKALIRLRHPGIVAIHDYGEHEGLPYIALELIEGPTLGALLAERGRLPADLVFAIFDQLLDVLVATHAAGVIHRDLKPENVMVLTRPDGPPRVTVLDFGIARLTDEDGRPDPRLTRTGAVFGTPSFMAPEQCRGRNVSPETDVYSVAVMMFAALTGTLPFVADNSAELFAKQLYVNPPTLAERDAPAELPAGLEMLVARALAKKATDRPSALSFQRQLRAIVAGEGAAAALGRAESERLRLAWRTRAQRADEFLGEAKRDPTTQELDAEDARVRVLVWGFSAARAHVLIDALAVNGIEGIEARTDPLPEVFQAALIAGEGWDPILRRLRPTSPTEGPPVLVADILAASDIPALVRAGATDIALSTIPDEALVAKVLRLVRRQR